MATRHATARAQKLGRTGKQTVVVPASITEVAHVCRIPGADIKDVKYAAVAPICVPQTGAVMCPFCGSSWKRGR